MAADLITDAAARVCFLSLCVNLDLPLALQRAVARLS